MNLVSFAEFSRVAGISKPAVTYLVDRDRKVRAHVDDNGKRFIDLDAPDVVAYLAARNLAAKKPTTTPPTAAAPPPATLAPGGPKKPRAKTPAKTAAFDVLEGVPLKKKPASKSEKDNDRGGAKDPLAGLPDFSTTDPSKIPVNYLPPEVMREKIATSRLARQIKKGEYINREVMGRFIAKLYRVHFGQLRPLGNTAAAQVAAALGVRDEALILKAEEKIDDLVFPMLTEIKRQLVKWLKDTETPVVLVDPAPGEDAE